MTKKIFRQINCQKVICSFYASTTYGSEYRAGLEFIKFAAANGFDLAIVADLEENSSVMELEEASGGMRVVRIPSLIKSQKTLYRYTDFVAQWVWHLRVARWLRLHKRELQSVWIQNGASPWLPLTAYFGLSTLLVWGPVGGGESPSDAIMKTLPWKTRLREQMRSRVEKFFLHRKMARIHSCLTPRVIAMARTKEAQRQLSDGLKCHLPIVPEIIDPLGAVHIHRDPGTSPRLIWVGQNIPRKNLPLALRLFTYLRQEVFPGATLDVFGSSAPIKSFVEGVTFHGWVPSIPWQEFQSEGVLLLTSFREGLPSTVLEAARNGLLIVTADIGAIASLNIPTIHLLPIVEYPNYTETTLHDMASRIKKHLIQEEVYFAPVSNRSKLKEYLRAEGVIE